MKIVEYPIIGWSLGNNSSLGNLLGTSYHLVERDQASLRSSFQSFIPRKLKKGAIYYLELKSYYLKAFTLEVRPAYKADNKVFPLPEPISVTVHVVHGPNDQGYFEAYFPELERSFYYYDASAFENLAVHFAREELNRYSPEDIPRLFLNGAPWLDTIKVKVPGESQKRKSGQLEMSYGANLTQTADRLPLSRRTSPYFQPQSAWERGNIVSSVVHELTFQAQNIVLVGKEGVGKSAIWEEVIKKMSLANKGLKPWEARTFWRTTPLRIISRAKYLGEWQEACETLVEELETANGWLWLEDLPALVTTGGEGPEDSMGAFIKPLIQSGKLRIIGELTPTQLAGMQRLLPGLMELFKLVTIPEMQPEQTRRLATYFNEGLEQKESRTFTQDALKLSYDLMDRFVRYERFPGKLMRFLIRCSQSTIDQQKIENEDVLRVFAAQSGMPEALIRDDILLHGEEIKAFFAQRIKGQDHVIDQLIKLIQVFKTGLNDPEKPLASLMFAGPTGVGKTATAQALADYFFGLGQKQRPLLRLDMSEFQHPAQIYRLIGSGGKLIEQVRERPFSVVLFDEIEKAHPMVFDALLMVLDEGLLMDALGRIADFRNTIIIMTTNLGAQQRQSLGFQPEQVDTFAADIKAFFRPEFVNRLDQVISFRPLEEEVIREISDLELSRLEAREGIAQRGLKLVFTERLKKAVAANGFDIKYGARPLQRYIEVNVVAPLARVLVEHPTWKRTRLELDLETGQLIVTPTK